MITVFSVQNRDIYTYPGHTFCECFLDLKKIYKTWLHLEKGQVTTLSTLLNASGERITSPKWLKTTHTRTPTRRIHVPHMCHPNIETIDSCRWCKMWKLLRSLIYDSSEYEKSFFGQLLWCIFVHWKSRGVYLTYPTEMGDLAIKFGLLFTTYHTPHTTHHIDNIEKLYLT